MTKMIQHFVNIESLTFRTGFHNKRI